MLEQGIIKESSSPWMASAVFNLFQRNRVNFVSVSATVNKQTQRDAYPLPIPDETQDRLVRSAVFSTLDLQSGY